jgi:hypothetical protein
VTLPDTTQAGEDPTRKRLIRMHIRIAWVGLLAFATLGLTLEGLHGFKSASYLGVGNETRRLMWTLAHAHGVGLSLVQIGFSVTVALCVELPNNLLSLASRLLNCAFVLIPGGFLLGGIATYGGDPSLGVLLVPVGAFLLLAAVAAVAWGLLRR